MRIVALDLSLTATGVYTDEGPRTLSVKLPSHATDWQRAERLDKLICMIGTVVLEATEGRADVVVLEGPSFGSDHSHQHSLGELAGIVKVVMYQERIPFVIVPPATLKKYATGKGNAPKDTVLIAAVKAAGAVEIRNNNEADAFWMHHMARAHYMRSGCTDDQESLLAKVEWPLIRKEEAVG